MRWQDLVVGIILLLLLVPSVTSGIHILVSTGPSRSGQVEAARTIREQEREKLLCGARAGKTASGGLSGTTGARASWNP